MLDMLLAWPVGWLLAVAVLGWRFSRQRDSVAPPWVAALSLPLMVAFGIHMAAVFVVMTFHQPQPAWWDPIDPAIVGLLDPVTWPLLLPAALCFIVACAVVFWSEQVLAPSEDESAWPASPRPRWSLTRRRVARLAAGLTAFAVALPLQVHHAVEQTRRDQQRLARRAFDEAEHARGTALLAVAERLVATAVAEDVAAIGADDVESIALTLTTLGGSGTGTVTFTATTGNSKRPSGSAKRNEKLPSGRSRIGRPPIVTRASASVAP